MAISMSHASIHYLQSLSNLLARKHDFYNTDAKAGSQKHSVAKVWLPLESSCLLLYPAASQFMPVTHAATQPATTYKLVNCILNTAKKKKKKKKNCPLSGRDSYIILFYYRLLQDIEYNSLCYIVGPCCLSILYIVVCIC